MFSQLPDTTKLQLSRPSLRQILFFFPLVSFKKKQIGVYTPFFNLQSIFHIIYVTTLTSVSDDYPQSPISTIERWRKSKEHNSQVREGCQLKTEKLLSFCQCILSLLLSFTSPLSSLLWLILSTLVMYAWPDGRENQIASLPPAHPTHRLQHLAKVTHTLHICLTKLEFWFSALGISEILHFGLAQIVCFWSKLNWLLNKYSWSLYTILPSRWQGVKITLHSIGLEKDQSIFISIFMWST